MIDDALAKTDRGVSINAKVNDVLAEIVTKIRQVDELSTQAAQASTEQSNGIAQVNTAIASMDKVTQSNAASAEECASASEELSAQAINMSESVADLLAIAEGTRKPAQSSAASSAHVAPHYEAQQHQRPTPKHHPEGQRFLTSRSGK